MRNVGLRYRLPNLHKNKNCQLPDVTQKAYFINEVGFLRLLNYYNYGDLNV